jgi:phosphoribosylamine--glycine ligase
LIEDFMTGQEVSVLALVDGGTIWILDLCQDHKQVGEGDVGPNTGGMGAFCPAPVLTKELLAIVEREVLVPAVDAMRRDGIEYRGVLYAGIMLTPAGPKVLEFNCRFGDPETQPLMARFKGDLVDVLWRTAAGELDGAEIEFDDNVANCVVMCSEGYPSSYKKGFEITGIEEAQSENDIVVFHAGTDCSKGNVRTSGGRVLGVTALASDLETARNRANAACEKIHFDGAFWRRDIGDRVGVAQV